MSGTASFSSVLGVFFYKVKSRSHKNLFQLAGSDSVADPTTQSPIPQPDRQIHSPVVNITARSPIPQPGRQSHSPVANPTAQSPIPLNYPMATPGR